MHAVSVTQRAADGLHRQVLRWTPDSGSPPVGVVVIAHGMGEHIGRYSHVVDAVSKTGFVVYGFDHRGHGVSIDPSMSPGDLGLGGWAALIDDIRLVVMHARAEFPGLPVAVVAHSMGSFATQQFLLDHGCLVEAVALIGTAALDLLEPALDLAAFNLAFAPARTDFDWLSRDESAVDDYIADPLCGFGIDAAAVQDMFAGARRAADPGRLRGIPDNLSVYIAVGSADPVNGGLTLLSPLVERYREAGIEDITVQIYPNARHEIFNEINKSEVIVDLLRWLVPIATMRTATGSRSIDNHEEKS